MVRFLAKILPLSFLYPIILYNTVIAQEKTLTIENINEEQIQLIGFTLNTDKEIYIESIGAGGDKEINRIHNFQEDPKNLFAYAWIIDARTRDLVWRMTIKNTESDWWKKWNRIFKGNIQLKKGEYELYFSSVEPTYFSFTDGFLSFGRIVDKVLGREEWWKQHSGEWKVTIKGIDEIFKEPAVIKYQNAVKNNAIVSLTRIGDNKLLKKGFSLKKPARLRIYAVGEGYKGEMYDYSWIIDASTQSKIWEMTEKETYNAGGAIKNRYINKEIEFQSGNYIVYCKSDDSHSFHNWNSNPPYDPYFWGITISGSGDDFDKSLISDFKEKEDNLIIQLDKLGNDQYVSQSFTLTKPTRLRIYAIGEGSDGEMFDYGWIEDVQHNKVIWKMKYHLTDEAGGAEKNRLYNKTLLFDPGSYLVHFITDDSHSYNNWNAREPSDPDGWGIKIYKTEKNDDEDFIKKETSDHDKAIIVQLIGVGNDEHQKKQFILKHSQKIHIYSIGEGDCDEMYDFAWIEDFKSKEIVWKMEYKDTENAGGSSKNRVYNKTIFLNKGVYIAHYRTDDSHAYDIWNAPPPYDRKNWGVTIYKE